jgi:hypothetical protein
LNIELGRKGAVRKGVSMEEGVGMPTEYAVEINK